MYSPRSLKLRYGFSLLEVVISITLLVLISVSIITSLMFSCGDEVEVTKGISAIDHGAGFRYTAATAPLIVKMRTGDSARVENTKASDAHT